MSHKADEVDKITALVEDIFEISAVFKHDKKIGFSLLNRPESDRAIKLLSDRLQLSGYRFSIDESPENITLTVEAVQKRRPPLINVVLFFMTLGSVYFVSTLMRYLNSSPAPFQSTIEALKRGEGITFTIALMSILLVHEMGHYIAGRRRDIVTSWPYFIPAPNIIGTFGAVITSKTPFRNRRDLIEVGASGPIAGWIVAAFWLIYGLSNSQIISQDMFVAGQIPFTLMGESIIMRFSTLFLIGPAPEGFAYVLSEAAFAGWFGMLLTAINMLPIGQLDGGHIVYGLAPKYQRKFGLAAMVALIGLGFYSPMWWFFAAFGFFFGVQHPRTIDDTKRPGAVATGLGITALLILIFSLTPIPF